MGLKLESQKILNARLKSCLRAGFKFLAFRDWQKFPTVNV